VDILSSRILLIPSDLEATLAFYRDGLALPVAREFGAGNHRGVVFFAGGGFIEVAGTGRGTGRDGVALWLQVRSMDETVAELGGRGITLSRAPVLEPWGLLEAWLVDPDGVHIHLVEVPDDHPLRRDARTVPDPTL
jgi:catechol 2,3-dioxygenase-like lactoylglutathione lyase family enzyme